MIKCCRDCREREPYCHTYCKRYIEAKAEHDRQLEEKNRERELNCWHQDLVGRQVRYAMRHRGRDPSGKKSNQG